MSSLSTDELISGVKIDELVRSIKSSDRRGLDVELHIPKFKIEYNFDKVETTLEKLGVRRAFDPLLAELENIPLKVSFPLAKCVTET